MNTKTMVLLATIALIAIVFVAAPAEETDATEGDAFQVNGATYPTLSDAISASSNGDTITMIANAATTSVSIDKDLKIDLGGHTLTISQGDGSSSVGINFKSGTSELNNGLILDLRSYSTEISGVTTVMVNGDASFLTVEEVTVEQYIPQANQYNYALRAQNNATLILNNGTIINEIQQTGGLGSVVGVAVIGAGDDTKGHVDGITSLIVNDVTIRCSGFGMGGSGSSDGTSMVVNDCDIVSYRSHAITHPQRGDLTINGGILTGIGGIQYAGNGTLTITGGTITATSDAKNFPQKPSSQGDGTTDDGAALSILSRGGGYQSAGDEIIVNITGGTFISQNNAPINSYRLQKVGNDWVTGESTSGINSFVTDVNIRGGDFQAAEGRSPIEFDVADKNAYSVSGGTFNSVIDSDIIADDASLKQTADGSFVAVSPSTVDVSGSGSYEFADEDYDDVISFVSDGDYTVFLSLDFNGLTAYITVDVALGVNTFSTYYAYQEGVGDTLIVFDFENPEGVPYVSSMQFILDFGSDFPYNIGLYYVDFDNKLVRDGSSSMSNGVLTYSGPFHNTFAIVLNDQSSVIPPIWDDDDDYVPPIVPSQTDDSGDDNTTTIVACAAAAVVAALMAAFLILDRRH